MKNPAPIDAITYISSGGNCQKKLITYIKTARKIAKTIPTNRMVVIMVNLSVANRAT
jgi:hypothetical protein